MDGAQAVSQMGIIVEKTNMLDGIPLPRTYSLSKIRSAMPSPSAQSF